MRPEDSKQLAIDASVARAAGNAEGPGRSSDCRDFLFAVLEIGHGAVFTQAMFDEWRRHEGNVARGWLKSMFAKKKIHSASAESDPALEAAAAQLAATLRDPEQVYAVREKMLKDLLLIEAARAGDRIVISLDDSIRGWFVKLAAQHGNLRRIAWLNPTAAPDDNEAWLQAGANPEPRHYLGASSSA